MTPPAASEPTPFAARTALDGDGAPAYARVAPPVGTKEGRGMPARDAARAEVTTPRNMTRTALALTMTGRKGRGRRVAARPKLSMRGTVPTEKTSIDSAPARKLPVPRA